MKITPQESRAAPAGLAAPGVGRSGWDASSRDETMEKELRLETVRGGGGDVAEAQVPLGPLFGG